MPQQPSLLQSCHAIMELGQLGNRGSRVSSTLSRLASDIIAGEPSAPPEHNECNLFADLRKHARREFGGSGRTLGCRIKSSAHRTDSMSPYRCRQYSHSYITWLTGSIPIPIALAYWVSCFFGVRSAPHSPHGLAERCSGLSPNDVPSLAELDLPRVRSSDK